MANAPKVTGYRVLEQVGCGGMGNVYRAIPEESPAQTVAVKVLARGLSLQQRELQRFLREGKLGQGLSHAHICPVLDLGCTDGLWWIVMEYIDGISLASRIGERATGRALAVDVHRSPTLVRKALRLDNLRVLVRVADALDFAHRNGVIHRDVKPANVMIRTTDDHPFLIDFGLARTIDSQTSVTTTGAILGSLGYMSPEQLQAHEDLTAATDIYSLGVTLYEVATGSVPFTARSVDELVPKVVLEEPPSLRRAAPDAPAGLEPIVLRALEKNPSDRYGTAGELRDDLIRVLAGGRPKGAAGIGRRRLRRRVVRHRTAIVAVLLAVAAFAAGVLLVENRAQAEQLRSLDEETAWIDVVSDQIPRAVRTIRTLVRDDPNDAERRLQLAALLELQGHHDEARGQLEEARRLGFDRTPRDDASSRDLYFHGLAHFVDGDLAAAEEAIESALARREDDRVARLVLVGILGQQRRFEEARANMKTYAAQIADRFPANEIHRARLAELAGNVEGAIALLVPLTRDDAIDAPLRRRAWANLGRCYLLRGDHELAERELARAIEDDPNDHESRLNHGIALVKLNRIDDAVDEARASLAANPRSTGASMILAAAAWSEVRDRPVRAEALLREAFAGKWDDDPSALVRAEAAFQDALDARSTNRIAGARAGFAAAIASDPEHLGARALLGEELWLEKDHAGALVELDAGRRAFERFEADPFALAGWRSFGQQARHFRQILEVARFSSACHLGHVETARESFRWLQDAIELDRPITPEVALNVAEALADPSGLTEFQSCRLVHWILERHRLMTYFQDVGGARDALEVIWRNCPP